MTDQSREEVTTELLDWYPRAGVTEFQDLRDFARQYGIGFVIPPQNALVYQVKLIGAFENVYQAISENWCANERDGSRSKDWYIRGLMGDTDAMEKWQSHDESDEVPTSGSDFAWDTHWKHVGVTGKSDERNPKFDEANEAAIELLANAGYPVPDGSHQTEHVDFAQSYLTLAFMHCPWLAELIMGGVEGKKQRYWHADGSECYDTEISEFTHHKTSEVRLYCDQHDERVFTHQVMPELPTQPR